MCYEGRERCDTFSNRRIFIKFNVSPNAETITSLMNIKWVRLHVIENVRLDAY